MYVRSLFFLEMSHFPRFPEKPPFLCSFVVHSTFHGSFSSFILLFLKISVDYQEGVISLILAACFFWNRGKGAHSRYRTIRIAGELFPRGLMYLRFPSVAEVA